MKQRTSVAAALLLVVTGVGATAGAVAIESFPQRVNQVDHEVTSGKMVSIETRSTVYAGNGVGGYDITVRNDGGTKLTVDVTVRLSTLDGTVVATESMQDIVLTGTSYTFELRFATAVEPSAFERTGVEAVVS